MVFLEGLGRKAQIFTPRTAMGTPMGPLAFKVVAFFHSCWNSPETFRPPCSQAPLAVIFVFSLISCWIQFASNSALG